MAIYMTATEANRRFSSLLRGVRAGQSYRITSRGEVVAEMHPPPEAAGAEAARRRKAWALLKRERERQPTRNLPHVTREQMHER